MGTAAQMDMGRARHQNAPFTIDAVNNNVVPENRITNGRKTKDEVGRLLQKDSRDAGVNTS